MLRKERLTSSIHTRLHSLEMGQWGLSLYVPFWRSTYLETYSVSESVNQLLRSIQLI